VRAGPELSRNDGLGGTAHFNFGAELTREHNPNPLVGLILEGPFDWPIRPVAEFRYEHEFAQTQTETVSTLVGAIWKLRDNLSLDFGVREAWVNRVPQTELRAGLTFALSFQQESIQRPSRSLRK
jgi:hypothetical protein